MGDTILDQLRMYVDRSRIDVGRSGLHELDMKGPLSLLFELKFVLYLLDYISTHFRDNCVRKRERERERELYHTQEIQTYFYLFNQHTKNQKVDLKMVFLKIGNQD